MSTTTEKDKLIKLNTKANFVEIISLWNPEALDFRWNKDSRYTSTRFFPLNEHVIDEENKFIVQTDIVVARCHQNFSYLSLRAYKSVFFAHRLSSIQNSHPWLSLLVCHLQRSHFGMHNLLASVNREEIKWMIFLYRIFLFHSPLSKHSSQDHILWLHVYAKMHTAFHWMPLMENVPLRHLTPFFQSTRQFSGYDSTKFGDSRSGPGHPPTT